MYVPVTLSLEWRSCCAPRRGEEGHRWCCEVVDGRSVVERSGVGREKQKGGMGRGGVSEVTM